MKNKKISIRRKLLVIMIGVILALLTTVTFIHYTSQKSLYIEELDRHIGLMRNTMNIRGKAVSLNLARYSENSIAAFDFFTLTQIIEKSVKEEKDLEYGILMDSSSVARIHTQNQNLLGSKLTSQVDKFASQQTDFAFNEFNQDGTPILEFVTPVQIGDSKWGVLRLGFSLSSLENEILDSRRRMKEQLGYFLIKSVSITVLFIFVGIVIVIFGARRITNPLQQLTGFSRKLAEGDFDAKVPETATRSNDEIGELASTFINMAGSLKSTYQKLENYSATLESKVAMRTKELNKKNEDLTHTLDELQKTQNQLIQSEKMASLGQLVAGVAHEINTPIGVGVTSVTFLQDQIARLKVMASKDEIDESEIKPLLKHISESGDLIFSNLTRASELITSFKQTSADQTSEERRSFNMHTVISNTLMTLRPKLKRTKLKLTLNCPESLVVDSFPGAISQIVTNLIMNSLIHAFDNGESGNINILAEEIDGGQLRFIYSDDGKGIPKELRKKIFDPFVTTTRGKGGTGLGLNIVFNLVNKALHGEIHCESKLDKGTTFSIKMPIKTD